MADIEVTPVSPAIGAEVAGVDLSRPLDEATFRALHEAWMDHLVLFFRDQDLGVEGLQALGRRFGELHIHPQGDLEGHPGIIRIHNDAESKHQAGRCWHSDVSCDIEPPAASILHLHQVPESGGDTLFANMYAAFEALSAPLRGFLSSLSAVHSGRLSYRNYFGTPEEETRDGRYPEAVHPVVCRHPVTGRQALFVNENFTEKILDLEPAESRTILDFLFRHLDQPRFQCRFRWRTNSAVLWDNRCVQHLALWDYWPETRSGHRVTICGARPMA